MSDAFRVGVKVALRFRRLGHAWIGAPGRAGTADPVFADGAFGLTGSADATKRLAFEVDGLSSSATRTVAAPTLTPPSFGTDSAQVVTNKTL